MKRKGVIFVMLCGISFYSYLQFWEVPSQLRRTKLLFGIFTQSDSFHPNGKPKATIRYVDGKPEGKFTEWNRDGSLGAIGEYRNGLLTGEYLSYSMGSLEGRLQSRTVYEGGRKNGVKEEFNESGRIESSFEYVEDEPLGAYFVKRNNSLLEIGENIDELRSEGEIIQQDGTPVYKFERVGGNQPRFQSLLTLVEKRIYPDGREFRFDCGISTDDKWRMVDMYDKNGVLLSRRLYENVHSNLFLNLIDDDHPSYRYELSEGHTYEGRSSKQVNSGSAYFRLNSEGGMVPVPKTKDSK